MYQHLDSQGQLIQVGQLVAFCETDGTLSDLGRIAKVHTAAVAVDWGVEHDRVYWHDPIQLRVLKGAELTWHLLKAS